MGLQTQVRVTCDHPGCKVYAEAWAEVHHDRIMDGALSEYLLAGLSVIDNPDLKGWKLDTGPYAKYGGCLCPIHNQPKPKGKPVDTSCW